MFGLLYETPPEWVARVEQLGLEALLSDHAHCELKAAATMQALIAKNHGHDAIVQQLPRLAMEELEHFERVEALLRARGGRLAEQDSSPYADGLQKASAATRTSLLLDRLLLSHLIEARSAERFHLLAKHLADRELAALYQDLLPSESTHRVLFQRLAEQIFGKQAAEDRLNELRRIEAQLLPTLPLAARVHSGPGA
ncbi:MAG: tRNA isopentenyl-2-thiomethyl-A-37 hydroxylase MiaE [Planctomycetota bacterium]